MAGAAEVLVIADSIGLRFHRDPLKAADAAGIQVRFRDLPGDVVLAYFHPTEEKRFGAMVISRDAATAQRPHFIAIGLAHHILRHRAQRPYTWTLEGLIEDDWRAEWEAREFVTALLGARAGRYKPGESKPLPEGEVAVRLVK